MEFSRRKLSKEEMSKLYRVKIDTVKPFALMLAPVYVWLKENEKFFSVKAPLDFFTDEELTRFKSYEFFYLPECAATVLPFSEAARKVRALLSIRPPEVEFSEGEAMSYPVVGLGPSSYELSNEILKIIGPLWWEYADDQTGIEPFLVTVFANELCDLLPSEKLLKGREQSAIQYDHALLRSSWAVFLALHLGYCNLSFLNRLRGQVFDSNMNQEASTSWRTEIEELIVLAQESVKESTQRLSQSIFEERLDRISKKLASRLVRVKEELSGRGPNPPTLYGEGGFIAVPSE